MHDAAAYEFANLTTHAYHHKHLVTFCQARGKSSRVRSAMHVMQGAAMSSGLCMGCLGPSLTQPPTHSLLIWVGLHSTLN